MEIVKIISAAALSVLMFTACVRESDEPPGCTIPQRPGLDVRKTTFTEGEDIILEATAPEGEEGGAFEWQGPNNYFLTQQRVHIRNARELHEGEYRVYYLNEGRCRSNFNAVHITVFSFPETCGLDENTIREELTDNDATLRNHQQTQDTAGNNGFVITAETDTMQIRLRYPVATRPNGSFTYNIAEISGAALGENEMDIIVTINGETFHAVKDNEKTITVFTHNNRLHTAFCNLDFRNQAGSKTLQLSGNVVVQ